MKIEFFGSSHGIPSDIRYCNCIMLECGESRYLFDVGAPAADLMIRKGYPFTSLKAVFVTHLHGDHFSGLLPLVDLSNWAFRDSGYRVLLPEQRGVDLVKQYVEVTSALPLRDAIALSAYEPGEIYRDEHITVHAVETAHTPALRSFGFLVEAEGKRIYLSGDMCGDLHDFPEFLFDTEVDLLVVELAHFSVKRLFGKLEQCKAKRICLNHVWAPTKIDEALARRDELQGELFAAADNDVITL